jgi:hypothetical protein
VEAVALLICASLPGEDGAEHVSYVAGLAPMLQMRIAGTKNGKPSPPDGFSVRDLVAEGAISLVD